MKRLLVFILGIVLALNVNSQCSAVPWTGWGFATECVVGSGYYNTGCVVSYDDGGGMRNYTAKGGPHHSNTPATGGTAYWTDNGLCGGDPPTLDPTTTSGDECMFATVTGKTLTVGGSDIKERGFVWNLTGNPDITTDAANKTVYDNTNTIGSFTSTITVDENKTIYVRAYAINTDDEEGYGNEVNFTTDQSATVTNVNAINIFCESMSFESSTTPNGQLFGAGVGTATITEYGFFYGTNVTAVDNATPSSFVGCSKDIHIANAAQASSLAQIIRRSEVTGLTPATKYYYKSYTTTNVCTGYGPRKDATTDAACSEYYSCSAAGTYDTDASCASPGDAPNANSIVYFRHDWRLTPGTALADLSGELPSQPKIGITPYRIVIEQGGYAYATGVFNAGTQVVVNTGGQFGYEGSPQLIVDGLAGSGLKFVRLTMNGGSFVTSASMTNYTDISLGSGEICNDGSFANNADAPGSVYGNYTLGGGLNMTRYTDAKCVGTFTLPIELLSFTANRHDVEYVTYNWVTGSEINNDYFRVEISIDGIIWKTRTSVSGAGNTFNVTEYSEDKETGTEYKYARLVQTDFDGTTTYSSIRNIATDLSNDVTIVPILNGFSIESKYSNIVNVYDMGGRLVYSELIPAGYNGVRLNLYSGIYFIKSGDYTHKLFIKN